MVRLLNKEINDKLEEIINYIKKTDCFKNYIKAKEILEARDDLKDIIKNIKKNQQKIVKNPKLKNELEKIINENLEVLESDITYLSYKNSLDEVNNLLTIFENKINKYFDEVFR